jgi:uncharacterized RDD family membrane protein YckC
MITENGQTPAMRYGGFWRRLGANWIDGLVMAPSALGLVYCSTRSRIAEIALAVPLAAMPLVYEMVLLGRYGQTLGKMAAGLEVRRLDGGRIDWARAWRRCMVQALFAISTAALTVVFYYSLTDAEYGALGWLGRAAKFSAWRPYQVISNLALVWSWSELLVLLLNKRRRALHDFIAGTVVVVRERPRGGGRWVAAVAVAAVALPVAAPYAAFALVADASGRRAESVGYGHQALVWMATATSPDLRVGREPVPSSSVMKVGVTLGSGVGAPVLMQFYRLATPAPDPGAPLALATDARGVDVDARKLPDGDYLVAVTAPGARSGSFGLSVRSGVPTPARYELRLARDGFVVVRPD